MAPRPISTTGKEVARWNLVATCLLASLFACTQTPAEKPHLILILVDTMRADHLGAYGYAPGVSPHIDALSEEGIVFEHAVAPSPWTRPSVASLFTSRFPSEHGAVGFRQSLPESFPTLAEILADAGYQTLGVTANPTMAGRKSGLARGFQRFEQAYVGARAPGPEVMSREMGGEARHLRTLQASALSELVLATLPPQIEKPLFLFVHYFDPHSPYDPPGRGEDAPRTSTEDLLRFDWGEVPDSEARSRVVASYDAEVSHVDAAIGSLLDALALRGILSNSVVTLVADHGEEFGEHGRWNHGATLHQNVLAVPLVIRDFREDGMGGRRDELVDLLDVPTTLLALAGCEPTPAMRGRALLGAPSARSRLIISEVHLDGGFRTSLSHRRALFDWPWKLVTLQNEEQVAYRLDRDPEEREPLAVDQAPESIRSDLARLDDELPVVPVKRPDKGADEAWSEALRALGYIE
ncbi:MAG: sulfatase [Deltaproteobacteria bacterium]|nr:sulfatase [Deltaproteobacteria bacterium]